MRTIRSYDPQSGITTVKNITLVSTSGVTFNEYNELPEKNTGVDSIRATQAVAESINSLATAAVFNQEQNVESMYNIAQSISEKNSSVPAEKEEVTADTLMVTIDDSEVSLNTAIGNLFQALNALTLNVNNLALEMSDIKTQISEMSSSIDSLTAKVDALTNTNDGE